MFVFVCLLQQIIILIELRPVDGGVRVERKEVGHRDPPQASERSYEEEESEEELIDGL